MKRTFSIRRTITCAAAAAVCAVMMSPQAFAEDILTDRSIYLENCEEAVRAVEPWVVKGKKIFPDPDTVMPLYDGSIFDYARTGNFEIEPFTIGNEKRSDGQYHIANAVDENGNFAGWMTLILENGVFEPATYTPSNNAADSVTLDINAPRISALMKKRGLNTDCKEVKLVTIEGVGYAYYIDNGTEKMLVAASISDTSEHIFNSKNGGLIIVGDELKLAAEAIMAGEPWSGDGYDPIFTVDNTPYLNGAGGSSEGSKTDNPNTGADDSAETTKRMAVLLVELSAIAAAGIGIKVIGKIRKNGR